jgi:hypothetical protein|tara:strand:+ start:342 stop:446 length:105 start_codon:yes stop_codon:yes gene_type:complete
MNQKEPIVPNFTPEEASILFPYLTVKDTPDAIFL